MNTPIEDDGAELKWPNAPRGREIGPTEVAELAALLASRQEPPPSKEFLGGPFTIWPGTLAVSVFARWNASCPGICGRVAVIGLCGAKDESLYRARAHGGVVFIDPAELVRLDPLGWKRAANEFRRGGAADMVVVYLTPPPEIFARLFDLIHDRGTIRVLGYSGFAAHGVLSRSFETIDGTPIDEAFAKDDKRSVPSSLVWTLSEHRKNRR